MVLQGFMRPRPALTKRLMISGWLPLAPLWPGSSTTVFPARGFFAGAGVSELRDVTDTEVAEAVDGALVVVDGTVEVVW